MDIQLIDNVIEIAEEVVSRLSAIEEMDSVEARLALERQPELLATIEELSQSKEKAERLIEEKDKEIKQLTSRLNELEKSLQHKEKIVALIGEKVERTNRRLNESNQTAKA